jgi:hypothetical protein
VTASAILAVLKKVPLYVYGFVILFSFGFIEGCKCERNHLKPSGVKSELTSAPPLIAETVEPPLAPLPKGEPPAPKTVAIVQPRGLGLGILPPKVTVVEEGPTYEAAGTEAAKTNVPVVAFVGVPVRPVRNAVACAVKVGQKIGDVVLPERQCIVVGYPGTVYRIDVPPGSDDEQITTTIEQVRTFHGLATVTTTTVKPPQRYECKNGVCRPVP